MFAASTKTGLSHGFHAGCLDARRPYWYVEASGDVHNCPSTLETQRWLVTASPGNAGDVQGKNRKEALPSREEVAVKRNHELDAAHPPDDGPDGR